MPHEKYHWSCKTGVPSRAGLIGLRGSPLLLTLHRMHTFLISQKAHTHRNSAPRPFPPPSPALLSFPLLSFKNLLSVLINPHIKKNTP